MNNIETRLEQLIEEQLKDTPPKKKTLFMEMMKSLLGKIFNPSSSIQFNDNMSMSINTIERFKIIVEKEIIGNSLLEGNVDEFLGLLNQVMIKFIYQINESELVSPEERVLVLKRVEESLSKTNDFLNFSPDKPAGHIRSMSRVIKENQQLILKKREKENVAKPYYCDNFDSNKLQKLHDLLLDEKLIVDNKENFVKTFQFHLLDNHKAYRTVWTGNIRQLVFLVSIILQDNPYQEEPIQNIIPRMFVKKDGKDFQNISTAYDHIETKILHFISLLDNNSPKEAYPYNSLPPSLRKIINIFKKIA